jgi:flagellar motor switch protein FliG
VSGSHNPKFRFVYKIFSAFTQVWPAIEESRYQLLFTSAAPDVSRTDNQVLAQATNQLAAAFASINEQYPNSDTLRKLLLKLLLKFSGEQQDDDVLQQIMNEAETPFVETHRDAPDFLEPLVPAILFACRMDEGERYLLNADTLHGLRN